MTNRRLPQILILLVWLASFGALLLRTIPVSGDGIYYFSYLRSAVIDHDLDFQNELEYFADKNIHVAKQLDSGVKTDTGLTHNLFSVGPAILWSPFYAVARMFALATGQSDGYSQIELMSISIGTALYGLLGLALAFSFIRKIIPEKNRSWFASASIISVLLGTNLIYYMTFDTSGSHVLGFFMVSLLLWLWQRWQSSKKLWHWLVIGLIVGLMGMVRWQLLGVAFVVPFLDFVWAAYQQKKWVLNLKRAGLVLLGATLGFLPQMLAWKVLYGGLLVIPQGRGFIDLTSPHFFEVLISNHHGLFTWAPLTILAGWALLNHSFKMRWAKLMLLILLVQTYINGTALEWWGGESFGPRRFTDISLVFMFGLALIIAWTWGKKTHWRRWVLAGIIAILIGGNLLFMQVYRYALIPLAEPVTLKQTLQAIGSLF